jgi:hypothetical protein
MGRSPLIRSLERYVLAHVAAYPIAFLWAMASMPLVIHLNDRALMALDAAGDEKAIGMYVVHKVAWPAGAVFVLPHLLGLPWAFGKDPARWRKLTWIGIGGVAAAGLLFGGASWLWLYLPRG